MKIKSFTLIEMVIAMLFSAIVVGMAYASLSIFSKLYDNYRLKKSTEADLQMVTQAISQDFSWASVIEIEDKQIILKNAAGGISLKYILDKDHIVRNKDFHTDTTKMEELSTSFFFEGHVVSEGILDHMVLNFSHEGHSISMSFSKHYSAEELFVQTELLQPSNL